VLLLTFLLACKDYAALCAANDPSVDAGDCWSQGWRDGYNAAYHEAYVAARGDAEETCDSGE